MLRRMRYLMKKAMVILFALFSFIVPYLSVLDKTSGRSIS